jgi:hypothetical protein
MMSYNMGGSFGYGSGSYGGNSNPPHYCDKFRDVPKDDVAQLLMSKYDALSVFYSYFYSQFMEVSSRVSLVFEINLWEYVYLHENYPREDPRFPMIDETLAMLGAPPLPNPTSFFMHFIRDTPFTHCFYNWLMQEDIHVWFDGERGVQGLREEWQVELGMPCPSCDQIDIKHDSFFGTGFSVTEVV